MVPSWITSRLVDWALVMSRPMIRDGFLPTYSGYVATTRYS